MKSPGGLISVGLILFVGGLAVLCWSIPRVEQGGRDPYASRIQFVNGEVRTVDPPDYLPYYEAAMFGSFLPIAAGGAMFRIGVGRAFGWNPWL